MNSAASFIGFMLRPISYILHVARPKLSVTSSRSAGDFIYFSSGTIMVLAEWIYNNHWHPIRHLKLPLKSFFFSYHLLMRMKILIVAKQNDLGLKMAMKVEKKLREITEDVSLDMSTALRLRKRGVSIRKFDGDLIVTVGGDGTFLHTSSRTNIPILPVKIEGHGFLCTSTIKELTENVK